MGNIEDYKGPEEAPREDGVYEAWTDYLGHSVCVFSGGMWANGGNNIEDALRMWKTMGFVSAEQSKKWGRKLANLPIAETTVEIKNAALGQPVSAHSHYFKDVSKLQKIDVYRVIELFNVPAGPIDHAVKKLLCAGNRGHKDLEHDIQDAIDSLLRWQEMRREDVTN